METPHQNNDQDDKDAAWAVVHTPLDATELKRFCRDIERLLRINPMLNFTHWRQLDANRYTITGRNISQQPPFDFELVLTVRQLADGLQIDYNQGLKSRTTIIVEPTSQPAPNPQPECRSKLTITDYYAGLPMHERAQQLHLVDKSIEVWADAIQQYLIRWQQWSKYRLYRWYMRTVWLPMRPMGRRIVTVLLLVAVFELALVALGAAIYFLEYQA